MADRKLDVEALDDGTWLLSGVAYEADKPNVNGRIYPEAVLKKAVEGFMAKSFRPVSYDLSEVKPGLASVVGTVEEMELAGGEVKATIKTLKTEKAFHWISALLVSGDIAIAGAGIGKVNDDKEIEEFEITSVGVVPLDRVMPKKE